MSRIAIVILICHRHKPINPKHLGTCNFRNNSEPELATGLSQKLKEELCMRRLPNEKRQNVT
jgi:hypothetical protein